MYISNESSVPFRAVQDGIACTPPRLSEVVPNVSNVGLTAWRWPSLILLPSFKCCLMSSDIGWHIRDKLRPVPKHGSVLLLRPRKPEGSLGRTAQDGHLDSHTAPELWSKVNMVLNGHRNHNLAVTLWRWGKREIIYLSLHCHHLNDFCIKVGSDESHLNVSVGSDGQSLSTNSVHKSTPFWRERRAEAVSNRGPSAYQPNALPLGQTGSHSWNSRWIPLSPFAKTIPCPCTCYE